MELRVIRFKRRGHPCNRIHKTLSKKSKEIICEGNQGKIRINFNKKVPKTPYQIQLI